MLISLIFIIITLITAVIITLVQKYFAVKEDPVVDNIDKLLPQTQCGQCGYPGCLPYAKAVADGDEINKCVPGGQELVVKLAELLNREVPAGELEEPQDLIAIIDEETCIGCLHCIEACPVDAIIGSKKLMHVIVPDYCTGCELCIPPCPVKCISMIERPKHLYAFDKVARSVNMPANVSPEQLINTVNIPADSNVNHGSFDNHASNDFNANTANASNKKSPATSIFATLSLASKATNFNKLSKLGKLGKRASQTTPSDQDQLSVLDLGSQVQRDNQREERLATQEQVTLTSQSATTETSETTTKLSVSDATSTGQNAQPTYVTPLVQRLAQRLAEHKHNDNNSSF